MDFSIQEALQSSKPHLEQKPNLSTPVLISPASFPQLHPLSKNTTSDSNPTSPTLMEASKRNPACCPHTFICYFPPLLHFPSNCKPTAPTDDHGLLCGALSSHECYK